MKEDKAYLLESRLMPLARKHGMKGLDELAQLIRTRRDETVINEVTEAMTTNESFFFRDIKPFDLFRDTVLPHLLESRAAKKSFRIWCAAASNGQEPYSLAMILNEQAEKLAGWRYEILGTDISIEVLECPSSKSLGRLSLFCNGGSGSPWIDVRPLFVDGSSGVSGSSVF